MNSRSTWRGGTKTSATKKPRRRREAVGLDPYDEEQDLL